MNQENDESIVFGCGALIFQVAGGIILLCLFALILGVLGISFGQAILILLLLFCALGLFIFFAVKVDENRPTCERILRSGGKCRNRVFKKGLCKHHFKYG